MGQGESFSVVNCVICSPFLAKVSTKATCGWGEKLWPWRSWNFIWLAGSPYHVMYHGACWYWMTSGMDWGHCVGLVGLGRHIAFYFFS